MNANGRQRPTSGPAGWLALLMVGALVAGCGSAAVTTSPSPSMTTSPTSAPAGLASADATQLPPVSPAATPTAAATVAPRATASRSTSTSSPEPSVAPAIQAVIPWGTYVVEYGDTLWDIGQRYGVTTVALEAANPQISDPTLIRTGDEITIPPTDWTAPVQPLANGTVVDSDLDGVGDLVVDITVEVGFNHGYWPGELRGVYEFDLRGVPRDQLVAYARVMIPVNGENSDGTDPQFTLFAGAGNGQIDVSDYSGGTLVRSVDAYESGLSMYLDLTDLFDRLHADGAEFVTLVFRPNPLASARRGTIRLADSVDAKYGFQEAQLTLKTGHVRWVPTDPRPHLMVQNVRFPSTTYCSLVAADITNYGDAVERSGWSITFEVTSLGISDSFMGQWGLAPSQRMTFDHNPQLRRRGTYEAAVSVDDAAGRKAVGRGTFSIPCGSRG